LNQPGFQVATWVLNTPCRATLQHLYEQILPTIYRQNFADTIHR